MFGKGKDKPPEQHIAIKFRAYPCDELRVFFAKGFGCKRFLYNSGLAEQTKFYEKTGKKHPYSYMQNIWLKEKKKEFPWLNEMPSQTLQVGLQNLERGYTNFFAHGRGKPQFKTKHDEQSICFPQPRHNPERGKNYKDHATISLPKAPSVLEFRMHRAPPNESYLKQAFVSRDKAGSYFLTLTFGVSIKKEKKKQPKTRSEWIGIDLGVSRAIATSQGKFFDFPLEEILRLEKVIAKKQRQIERERERIVGVLEPRKKTPIKDVSVVVDKRKIEENVRCRKLRQIVKRCFRKITRIRQDWIHKRSHELVKNHDVIVMEDLNLKNMSKSASGTTEDPGKQVAQKRGLNRAILRMSHGELRRCLVYKAARAGKLVFCVDPRNTSRRCRLCGHCEKANRKSQVEFLCVKCGHAENADVHAAKNILTRGRAGAASGLLDLSLEAAA